MDKSIQVFQSTLHGEGVLSLKVHSKNDVIFSEFPLYAIQSLPNRRDVIICGNCFSFLGSENQQLDILLQRTTRQKICENITNGTTNDLINCRYECGELYCSKSCEDKHWNKGHRFLCTGTITNDSDHSGSSSLLKFKLHAVDTNEIFLLVADIFADIVSRFENSNQISDVVDSIQLFQKYVHNIWWDIVKTPPDREPEEFKSLLRELAHDSFKLLSETLQLEKLNLSNHLSFDFMSRLIGTFEQNNVGIRLSSPISTIVQNIRPGDKKISIYLQAAKDIIDNLEECEWEDAEEIEDEDEMAKDNNNYDTSNGDKLISEFNPCTGDPQLDELQRLLRENGIDTIFPPLDGTGFYKMICKINHSCDPNVIVKYTINVTTEISTSVLDSDEYNPYSKPLIAQVTALRSITAGEELVQSYIDSTLSYKERQLALSDYGFVCTCRKCASEAY